MSKLIFWVVIILLVLLVMRLAARAAAKRAAKPHARAGAHRRPPPASATQPMVRCAHCGVHLPAADALHRHNHHWCSEAHAQLGPRQQS